MTEAEALQQVDRTFIGTREGRLSYFSGCDYFRMASNPLVLSAVQEGLRAYGLNVAASRVTTGNHALYEALELQLAEFFQAEDALLLPSGYVTSLAVAQALAGTFTHALIDERAHLCLFDATRFLECPLRKFRHRDADDLARVVRSCGKNAKPILLTDGLFASDGSVAPLGDYLAVLPKSSLMLVDDAHAAGVVGQRGRGSLEVAGVSRRQIIQAITLSKAFGAYGGAVLATKALRLRIVSRSRLFPGATPVPLPLANAALASVRLLATDERFLQRLRQNTGYVRRGLRAAGLHAPETPGPIVAVPTMSARRTAVLKQRLLEAGVYPPLIRYPGAPATGYFRFVISSEHTTVQLENLVSVLVENLCPGAR